MERDRTSSTLQKLARQNNCGMRFLFRVVAARRLIPRWRCLPAPPITRLADTRVSDRSCESSNTLPFYPRESGGLRLFTRH